MYQQPQQQQQPRINRAKSYDNEDEEEFKLEIIKQGYGIHDALKTDILEFYKISTEQKEYKNPADFIKHRLDGKYGPYWFVFMWEHKNGLNAQYSYYNNDDKVFEFRLNGWHVLIYSFNQTPPPTQFKPPHSSGQSLPQYNTQFAPPLYDRFDDYTVDPRYPYPGMQGYQQQVPFQQQVPYQGPSQFRQPYY